MEYESAWRVSGTSFPQFAVAESQDTCQVLCFSIGTAFAHTKPRAKLDLKTPTQKSSAHPPFPHHRPRLFLSSQSSLEPWSEEDAQAAAQDIATFVQDHTRGLVWQMEGAWCCVCVSVRHSHLMTCFPTRIPDPPPQHRSSVRGGKGKSTASSESVNMGTTSKTNGC
eukprot:scaffold676_cov273-Pinguiococcus_pyrenoidosus.AAC.5